MELPSINEWRLRIADYARMGVAVGREAGAYVIASELYPLGMVGQSMPVLPQVVREEKNGHPPVLFIHGIFHNRSAFAWLKQRMSWRGWNKFAELNLTTSLHSIPRLAAQTSDYIKRIQDRFGTSEIDIVAHSMGGIVARYFLQQMSGDGHVRHLITIGTPHQGTRISRLSLLPHLRELAPQSPTMKTLKEAPPLTSTQALAISGSMDIFASPQLGGWWHGVRNIELSHLGHTGLLFSRRVARIVMARLSSQ